MQSMDNHLLLGTLMSASPSTPGALASTPAQVAGGMPGNWSLLQLPPGQHAENPEESFFALLMAEGGEAMRDATGPAVSPLFAAIHQEFGRAEAGRDVGTAVNDAGGKPLPPTAATLPPEAATAAVRGPGVDGEMATAAIERNRVIALQLRTDARADSLRAPQTPNPMPPSAPTPAPATETDHAAVPEARLPGSPQNHPVGAMLLQGAGGQGSTRTPVAGAASAGLTRSISPADTRQRVEPMTFDSLVPTPEAPPMPAPGHTPAPDGGAVQVAATVLATGRGGAGIGAKSAEAAPEQELIEITDGVDFNSEFRHSLSGTERPQSSTAVLGLGRAVGAPQWAEALAGRVQYLVGQNLQRAEIRLDPPELGALEVRINLSDGNTQVHFGAENAAAREALESALPRLRELMSQSGFAEVQVDVGDRQQQQLAGEDAEDRGERRASDGGEADDLAEPTAAIDPGRLSAAGSDRMFDAYA